MNIISLISSLFFSSGSKIKIFLIIGGILILVIVFLYIKNLNNRIDYLNLELSTYKSALEESNKTVEILREQNRIQRREIERLFRENNAIINQRNEMSRRLNELLRNERDPRRIEREANEFINDIFRRLNKNTENK